MNDTSSATSTSFQNPGNTEVGRILAINQDSKLNFKDYIELTQSNQL